MIFLISFKGHPFIRHRQAKTPADRENGAPDAKGQSAHADAGNATLAHTHYYFLFLKIDGLANPQTMAGVKVKTTSYKTRTGGIVVFYDSDKILLCF
ncbi:MAG: hypothetical protein ACOY4H_07165 [Thermodesulfobacteriota bacterium]